MATLSQTPLAQSFRVPSSSGCFVTGVDLFFKQTSNNQSSVILELRNVNNGYPTGDVLGKKTLTASSITGSSNSTVSVPFNFDFPIYLLGNKEYCFVIKTDSSVLDIWVSKTGHASYLPTDTSTPTGQLATKQANIGKLFRASTGNGWVAEDSIDLKFAIRRAAFITTPTSVTLTNTQSSSEVDSPYLTNLSSPIATVSASNILLINHPNHGIPTGSTVTLTGTGTVAGIPSGELWGVAKVVTKVNIDSYTIQTTTPANVTAGGLGGNITATAHVTFSSAVPKVIDFVPNGTTVGYSLNTKQFGSTATQTGQISNGSMVTFSKLMESVTIGDSALTVSASMDTSNEYISPVIDLDSSGVICSNHRITPSSSNNPLAVYVQKPITLISAANSFITYFDCSRPPATDVQLFYRIAQDNVKNLPWIQVQPTISGYTTGDDFMEFKFQSSTADFYVMQIKLVMYSDSEVFAPVVKNLRTITLKS